MFFVIIVWKPLLSASFHISFFLSFHGMGSLCQTISSFSSNPLVSAIVALYTLIFLYVPSPFRRLLFSPLLVSTSVLFFSVLRLRSSLRTARFGAEKSFASGPVEAEPAVQAQPSSLQAPRDSGNDVPGPGHEPDPNYEDSFVEWNVRAPLEVIQEEYEDEEEDDDDDVLMRKRAADVGAIERYASLSLCYPETDSDSCSSDGEFPEAGEWGSPGKDGFRWEGVDREELIEIKLDGKRSANEVLDEDNLIEIDLSPVTTNGGLCDDEVLD